VQDAGLRQPPGSLTPKAIHSGAGRRPSLGKRGLQPLSLSHATRIRQWVDLLAALIPGPPSITLTADQMAQELSLELVKPVNQQLQCDGCSYRVPGRRSHRRSLSASVVEAGRSKDGSIKPA